MSNIPTAEERIVELETLLRQETTCGTCEGAREITSQCEACLCGEGYGGRCTCDQEKPFRCPECEGAGFICKGPNGEAIRLLHAKDAEVLHVAD